MWNELKDLGVWEGEVVNRRRDGALITEILRIQTIKNRRGVVEYYVASFVDISHRKELENRLRTLSEKDSLTGLSNRRRFELDMQTQLQRSKRYSKNETATLALIDIDHFKRVNDHFGHDKGDLIIQQVANSLSSHLRETDMISRIGGEEFAAIMPHTPSKEACIVLNRLRTAINQENDLNVTVSIGFSEISGAVAQTYKRADTALYESKASGRNCVNEFSLSDTESIA
jgi:diguanylate cyclase (GGDEF)-like protein